MSEQVKDGGSAFPVIETTIEVDGQCDDYTSVPNVHSVGGMTLRDYFAAKVFAGLVCSEMRTEMTVEDDAGYAYKAADAMLAAREAKS